MRSFHRKKGNFVLRRLPGFILLITLIGCSPANMVSVHYQPNGNPRRLVPPDKPLTIFVAPIVGHSDKLWYRNGEYSLFLEKRPTTIVQEALLVELQRLGIRVTNSPSRAQGRLETQLRWFAPYGSMELTAAIIISLALYPREAKKPLWRGRLQAGVHKRAVSGTVKDRRSLIKEVVSEALTKAITQLRWKPGFAHSVTLLVDM